MRFNSQIEKIIVEHDIAKGLISKDGTSVYSDITISAADWHYTRI